MSRRSQGIPLKHLFSEGRALWTLLLWVPFFAAFGVLILAVLWTPTLLHDNGIPLAQAASAIAFNGLGALIGMGSAGRLIERFGAAPVLVPAFLLGAVTTALLGYAAASCRRHGGRRIPDRALRRHGWLRRHRARGADLSDRDPLIRRRLGHGRGPFRARCWRRCSPGFAAAAGWSSVQLFVVLAIAPVLAALAIFVLRAVPAQAGATEEVAAASPIAS